MSFQPISRSPSKTFSGYVLILHIARQRDFLIREKKFSMLKEYKYDLERDLGFR
jgi:hypothetical protein